VKSIHSSASLALFALSFLAGCGSEASVVGGRCRDGMELRGDTCMAPPTVVMITPGDPKAGASGGSSTTSTAGSEIGTLSTTPARPAPPSFVLDPNNNPFQIDPDVVLPPQLDPPIVLPPPQPLELVCDAPLVACHGVCIPVASDGANCGACGKICPSNICIDGECQGATPGDVVLIGHDYTNAWSGSAQAKVLVNAFTIPTTDPIRVLSYEDGASANAVAQAKALAAAGLAAGRAVRFTVAESATELASDTLTRNYDIVLIHDAGPGDAATVGASWATSLNTFTMKGGVVLALDNGLSPMPQLMTSSGLLSVASHTLLADGTHLAVTGAADVVGAQVLSPYAGFGASVSFQGIAPPSADFDWVVRATGLGGTLGDPVVIHRIVRDEK
jgi:hypothetical protein